MTRSFSIPRLPRLRPRRLALKMLIVTLLPLPAFAEQPSLDFFTGSYLMIGADASSPPGLIYHRLRMEPDGDGLKLQSCGAGDGRLDRAGGELPNSMTGSIYEIEVWCSYYNNADNYAHLACYGAGGEKISLWPTMEPTEDPLSCG